MKDNEPQDMNELPEFIVINERLTPDEFRKRYPESELPNMKKIIEGEKNE